MRESGFVEFLVFENIVFFFFFENINDFFLGSFSF